MVSFSIPNGTRSPPLCNRKSFLPNELQNGRCIKARGLPATSLISEDTSIQNNNAKNLTSLRTAAGAVTFLFCLLPFDMNGAPTALVGLSMPTSLIAFSTGKQRQGELGRKVGRAEHVGQDGEMGTLACLLQRIMMWKSGGALRAN